MSIPFNRHFVKILVKLSERSSIVKLPGNVPPAMVYFFRLIVWPRVYSVAILF